MQVEDFWSVERILKIDENFEIVEPVLIAYFELYECEFTKKDNPADEMKYLWKEIYSLWYSSRLLSSFLILLPLISC